jgi:hypothetical protein
LSFEFYEDVKQTRKKLTDSDYYMSKHKRKRNTEHWKEFDISFIKDDDVVALIDGDFVVFKAASNEMKRYIQVEIDGVIKKFGGYRELKKYLKEIDREDEYSYFYDKCIRGQYNNPRALINAKSTIKKKIKNIADEVGATVVIVFMGSDGNHRDSLPLPKLQSDSISCFKYKGQRGSEWVPETLDNLKEWTRTSYYSHWSVGRETDDDITITFHRMTDKGIKAVLCAVDKDYNQEHCGGLYIIGHHDKPTMFQDTEENRLGWLGLDRTKKPPKMKGHGDMFLAYQMITEDDADNYSAKKFLKQYGTLGDFGDVAALKLLSKAKTRTELWQIVYDHFCKYLPEELDYEDCFGEVRYYCTPIYFVNLYYKCAKMMEHTSYVADIRELFDELGVIYDK